MQAILAAKTNEDAEVGRVVDALKNAFQGSFDDEMVKILVSTRNDSANYKHSVNLSTWKMQMSRHDRPAGNL